MFLKCSNHLGCLLGYHGEDIEVGPDHARVCPECGSPLRAPLRGEPWWRPVLINVLILAAIGVALWLLWPTLHQWWARFTAK